jgi:hypothetical protein
LLWRTFSAAHVTLSEDGAVATQTIGYGYQWSLTTTETELTEGKHYWEVEVLSKNMIGILIGISRPNLNPAGEYFGIDCTDGWFIYADEGALWGNGMQGDDRAGEYNQGMDDAAGGYKQGDRVGVLLDLDNGSLRFFKNGAQHGPGFPAGSVTGPVVAAVQMGNKDTSVRLLPNAEAPTNA